MASDQKRIDHRCTCSTCRNHPRSDVAKEHRAINRVLARLDEKGRRRLAGLLAMQRGRGSIEELSIITGLSRPTIRKGRDEVQRGEAKAEHTRVRTIGAGRPRTEKNIPMY
jgi:hypothetical protein